MYAIKGEFYHASWIEKKVLKYSCTYGYFARRYFENWVKFIDADKGYFAWSLAYYKNGVPLLIRGHNPDQISALPIGRETPASSPFCVSYVVLCRFLHVELEELQTFQLITSHWKWARDFFRTQLQWLDDTKAIYAFELLLMSDEPTRTASYNPSLLPDLEKPQTARSLFRRLADSVKDEMN